MFETSSSTEFDSYFTALTVGNNKRNPWFSEYWEKVFDCSMTRTNHTGRRRCTGTYGSPNTRAGAGAPVRTVETNDTSRRRCTSTYGRVLLLDVTVP